MIVTLSRWRVSEAADIAESLGCDVCIAGDKQASLSSLHEKRVRALDGGRTPYLDLRWYRSAEPSWFRDLCPLGRANFDTTDSTRREFFRNLATRFPTGPLIAPSGAANEIRRSLDLALELAQLRDTEFSGRGVFASVTLNRQGLNDAVLSQFIPPQGIQGFLITVLDASTYPSIWSENEWFTWLRLVGTLASYQYSVILAGSDVRGLVASALGAIDFTTGFSQQDRQAPQDVPTSNSGGGEAPVSYLSAPLLAILHGEKLAIDSSARPAAETHSRCAPFGRLGVPRREASFDPDWLQSGSALGDRTRSRISRHITDMHAIESWIRSSEAPVQAMELLLEHAQTIGQGLPADVFKSPGSREELTSRLRAFQAARNALGI